MSEPRQTAYSIDDALDHADSVTTLLIEDSGLTELPPTIRRLKKLRGMYLAGNRLRRLPDEIGELEELEELNVFENVLEHLPRSIGQLPALRRLSLNDNRLGSIPDLGALSRLVFIDLSNNPLTALPRGFERLQALEQANLSSLTLGRFPEELEQLPQLRILELWSADVPALPPTVGRLRRLEELFLQENGITAVPESLGELHALRRLSLADNALVTIPESLSRLEQLEMLDLRGNHLRSLPARLFFRLSELKQLHLMRNPLGSVPEQLGRLRRLETLSLGGCGLHDLGDGLETMFGLTALSVDDNPLGQVPLAILVLEKLTWLSLRRTGLESLPDAIGRLAELRALFLAGNELRALGDGLERLPELATLDVRDNALAAPLRSLTAKLLIRGNDHAPTPEAADRRWSLLELRQTAVEMPACPHVHDPRLPQIVERIARSATVVVAVPTQELLAEIVTDFERSLEETSAADVAIAVALRKLAHDAPVPPPWRTGQRARLPLTRLAWCMWSVCAGLPARERELLGAVLEGVAAAAVPRFALYDVLERLLPSAQVPAPPTATDAIDRAIRYLAMQRDGTSFKNVLAAPEIRFALERQLVEVVADEPALVGKARTLAAVLVGLQPERALPHLKAALAADPDCSDAAFRLAKLLWGMPVLLERRPLAPIAQIRRLLRIAEARAFELELSGSHDDVRVLAEALEKFE